MDSQQSFSRGLSAFVRNVVPPSLELAQVVSYDSATETVVVESIDGIKIFGVRLTAKNATDQIVVVPKTDSWVLIGRIEGSDVYSVIQASEIEKVKGTIGATSFEIDTNGIKVLRNGQNLKTTLNNLFDFFKTATYIAPNGVVSTLNPPLLATYTTLLNQLNMIFK